MDNPLVTCLCLTKNRQGWLSQALENFEQQTYPNRELVVVADSCADVVDQEERRNLISEDHILVIEPGVVGHKRNVGCEAARGEIIAVWDDDDYSAPGRLAAQVERLRVSGKAITGYRDIKFTDGSKWWQYTGGGGFAAGTSLCFLRSWWRAHKFREINCGQDEAFALFAADRSRKQLDAEPDRDLMYATVHPGNTSPRHVSNGRSLVGTSWKLLKDFEWKDGAGLNAGVPCAA